MTVQLIDPQLRMPLPEQGEWTYEDWRLLPNDGYRYEVFDGVLYMSPPPSIWHQNAVSSLLMWMRKHAQDNHLGLVLTAPVGVRLPGQPVPVQPDILFVRRERDEIVGDTYIEGAPDLIVEILSPSNWVYDRGKKQEAYQSAGVAEYWIVDYRTRTVDVFVLEERAYVLLAQFHSGDVAYSTVLENFHIKIDEIFRL